ncbi:fumarylacetoacetase [Sphingomonas quercus]|nr:fumarylacetoacetase [Sphingomonas quercus]
MGERPLMPEPGQEIGLAGTLDETHDPMRSTWVSSAVSHPDFPIQNLPLGIFSTADKSAGPGVAIGDRILDLAGVAHLLPAPFTDALGHSTLNALLSRSPADRRFLRRSLSHLLSSAEKRCEVEPFLHDAASCDPHLPFAPGDYTDFYAGIHHARSVGRQLRPDNPLLPNYKWMPIAYHGRASSVRVSGQQVRRPSGQHRPGGASSPLFAPSDRLDFELELGLWIAQGNDLGVPIPIDRAGDQIAGLSLLNDWSARDLQVWEYQPLGPFLAKSFHTSVSPWVVTAEALAPFRMAQPARGPQDPPPLPHLHHERDQSRGAFRIQLEAFLSSALMRDLGHPPLCITRVCASNLYWTAAQMVAHHSSNGCNLRPGDLLGTGTISGPDRSSCGSLIELTRGGADPITLPTGEERRFLHDGDEVTLAGCAIADGYVSIGLGICTGRIVP